VAAFPFPSSIITIPFVSAVTHDPGGTTVRRRGDTPPGSAPHREDDAI